MQPQQSSLSTLKYVFCYTRPMKQLIILRGYPGSGKTSVGNLLGEDPGRVFIDHNKILTLVASIAGNDEGIYDEIHAFEIVLAKKVLTEGKSVIVGRGFSSSKSIEPYNIMAEKYGAQIQVIRLQAPHELLEKRVEESTRSSDFNPVLSAESLRKWVKDNPLEEVKGEMLIDASQPLKSVCADILRRVN